MRCFKKLIQKTQLNFLATLKKKKKILKRSKNKKKGKKIKNSFKKKGRFLKG